MLAHPLPGPSFLSLGLRVWEEASDPWTLPTCCPTSGAKSYNNKTCPYTEKPSFELRA